MKETGARIVARTPTLAMCFSTSYLLSKCGMPVCRLAEPTEVKTRCTPAALAASAATTPCRVSAPVPPDGVVIAKREVAPSSAFVIAAVSSSDAATSVAPAFASDFAWLELGSRVTARTLWPRSRRPRATAPPCLPVDPVATTVSSCAMFWFLSPAVILHQMSCASPGLVELCVPCTGQSRLAPSSSSYAWRSFGAFGELRMHWGCLARHPQMSIELVLTDRQVELVEEKFDLAFRTGTLKDTSLVAHELWRAQPRCFAAPEYLRDRGTPRTPRDLLRHDCILFTPLAPRGRWTFRSRGRTVEVPVRGRLVVNSIPLALDAAMRGLGIVRVPGALVVEGLAAKQLVEVLDTYAPPPRPAYAVHPSGGRVAPAARVFLEIAKRHLERKGW